MSSPNRYVNMAPRLWLMLSILSGEDRLSAARGLQESARRTIILFVYHARFLFPMTTTSGDSTRSRFFFRGLMISEELNILR